MLLISITVVVFYYSMLRREGILSCVVCIKNLVPGQIKFNNTKNKARLHQVVRQYPSYLTYFPSLILIGVAKLCFKPKNIGFNLFCMHFFGGEHYFVIIYGICISFKHIIILKYFMSVSAYRHRFLHLISKVFQKYPLLMDLTV